MLILMSELPTKTCSGILTSTTFHGKLLNVLELFTKFVPILP